MNAMRENMFFCVTDGRGSARPHPKYATIDREVLIHVNDAARPAPYDPRCVQRKRAPLEIVAMLAGSVREARWGLPAIALR
jgi:hypothetical protein